VLFNSIDDILSWCGPQSFLVRFTNRCDRCIPDVLIACNAGGVVGTFVVVTSEASGVEAVDDIGSLEVLLSKMRGTVSNFFIFTQCIKWPVRHVSRVSLLKRATASESAALQLAWRWVA
jgi:hypothetical protein